MAGGCSAPQGVMDHLGSVPGVMPTWGCGLWVLSSPRSWPASMHRLQQGGLDAIPSCRARSSCTPPGMPPWTSRVWRLGTPTLFQGWTWRCRVPCSALVRMSPPLLLAACGNPFPIDGFVGLWDLPQDPQLLRHLLQFSFSWGFPH